MARAPTLYGPDGRPLLRRGLLREHARPSLVSVRQPWMLDAIAPELTPARLAAVIRDADAGETREMYTLALEMEERAPRYGSVLGVRRRAPAFRRLLAQCLWGLGPGFSAVEILWDRSGRRRTPAGYAWRDPRWSRWGREDAHQLRLLSDEAPAEGEPLAYGKWVVHAPSLRPGMPARGGLARPVAALFCLASWGLADWAGWLEAYGRPIRLGKYGPSASEDDIAILHRAVAGIGSDAAATIPESMALELVESAWTSWRGTARSSPRHSRAT